MPGEQEQEEDEEEFDPSYDLSAVAAGKKSIPTSIAGVNLVTGCSKVLFLTILTAALAY